ncbi:MAG: DUF971 domain-containing protein [Candidatus Omnitrophota bacterium]|nr:DUF971 domain-containing protein [Candidatus Omnitrophota bacterium]
MLILWPDGHRSLYAQRYLRFQCHCAQCIEEWTGRQLISLDQVDSDVHALNISPVGNYAVKFQWSDGHSTGIYSYELLRGICPCKECAAKGPAS